MLLYWDDILLMMGPRGDPVRYFYDEPIILIPECDGVRILSNSSMELLQRVPDSTESIFKIGSTSPAALLYDALDHFDRRSAKVGTLFLFLITHKEFIFLKLLSQNTVEGTLANCLLCLLALDERVLVMLEV